MPDGLYTIEYMMTTTLARIAGGDSKCTMLWLWHVTDLRRIKQPPESRPTRTHLKVR